MWDLLIEQTVTTLNLFRQNLLHPNFSDWAYCNGALNHDDNPMGPMGSRVMIHEPEKLRLF